MDEYERRHQVKRAFKQAKREALTQSGRDDKWVGRRTKKLALRRLGQ